MAKHLRDECGYDYLTCITGVDYIAENKLEEYTLSSPAISDGQIFMRTEKALYCIGKRVGTK